MTASKQEMPIYIQIIHHSRVCGRSGPNLLASLNQWVVNPSSTGRKATTSWFDDILDI